MTTGHKLIHAGLYFLALFGAIGTSVMLIELSGGLVPRDDWSIQHVACQVAICPTATP